MPFTISHAAVVLPFARLLVRWRLLSAFVIGAMVPDFGLFFPWRIHRFESHSTLALLTFCVPVGLSHLLGFPILDQGADAGGVAGGRLCALAPFFLAGGLRQHPPVDTGRLRRMTGAVTHLVWDAFTHENARGVRMIPWLEEPIVEIGNHHMAGVRLMQDGSSLFGLVVVIGLVLVRSACRVGVPRAPSPSGAAGAPRVGGSVYRCRDWLERRLAVLGARGRARGAPSCVASVTVSLSRRSAAWPLHCCLPVSPLTGVCARWLSAARTEHRSL